MKKIGLYVGLALVALSCSTVKNTLKTDDIVDKNDVQRILNTLASDEMEGRATFSIGIEKAADFIAEEFKKGGLQPMYEENYRQTFFLNRIMPNEFEVQLDGKNIESDNIIFSSTLPGVNWNSDPHVEVIEIKEGEEFAQKYRSITNGGKDALVIVHPSFKSLFGRYKNIMMRGRMVGEGANLPTSSVVFVIADQKPASFRVSFTNLVEKLSLFNVVATIPGKSKPNEYVIFSAHYDHIGKNATPVGQDSIANGADDDASGVSAMISLAKYYKKKNDNERTLVFVAFTAEEIGMYGSKYFSEKLNPDDVTALINIEMIGKDSQFGPNSLYVTGFNHSNLAKIMQENVKGTPFTFNPDPYPTQNLFYRSDNATLAALGVPAHTFSTVQIDKDQYYHTVKDEVSTLNVDNIVSSIKALAVGAESIISGKSTPSRVEKLRD